MARRNIGKNKLFKPVAESNATDLKASNQTEISKIQENAEEDEEFASEDLVSKNISLTKRISELEQIAAEYIEEIEQLKNAKSPLQQEIETLKKENAEYLDLIAQLKSKLVAQEQELDKCKQNNLDNSKIKDNNIQPKMPIKVSYKNRFGYEDWN